MSSLIDVAIGLALVFFLASMLCSSVQEIIARYFSARGKLMREGLTSLVPDRWLYLRLINHPMVSGLYRGRPGKGSRPSYLPTRNFTLALVDTLLLHHGLHGVKNTTLSLGSLTKAIQHARSNDLGIGHTLLPVVEAAPDLETAMANIDVWFDSTMDRVSGWYKSYSQQRLLIIGLVTAALFNIDTLQITASLSHSAELRAAIVATTQHISAQDTPANIDARVELKRLVSTGLPIGYTCPNSRPGNDLGWRKVLGRYEKCVATTLGSAGNNPLQKLIGWLLTALATTLGAPFWFDAIKKLVNARNSGPAPSRKS